MLVITKGRSAVQQQGASQLRPPPQVSGFHIRTLPEGSHAYTTAPFEATPQSITFPRLTSGAYEGWVAFLSRTSGLKLACTSIGEALSLNPPGTADVTKHQRRQKGLGSRIPDPSPHAPV